MAKIEEQKAFALLLELSEKQGYITFDDIMASADAGNLPISSVDWLSSEITTRGILVYDEAPSLTPSTAIDDYEDYAQIDYENVFRKVVELSPSLEQFVEAIRRIRPPQYKEISQLKYQVAEGNMYARQRMIEMHLRLALKIALNRTEQYDMDIVDAVDLACIGLIIAADKYNPDSNGAFGSYASLWIVQNISREQATQNPDIYFPAHKKEDYYSLYPEIKSRCCEHCEKLHRCKTFMTRAMEKLGNTAEQAADTLMACSSPLSIDVILENMETEPEKYPQLAYALDDEIDSSINFKDLRATINSVLNDLSEKESDVLKKRFGLDDIEEKTLEEIGDIYGVTRERVRQIEFKAIRKLGHSVRSKRLVDYY
ncbi:sigma-70 family RNA polymerase sigma factor [Bengtsoniella intestinalis]|uniref:sigma-70 family RNA polymerase sigma factor n=1 Tax=Bengtsoniella intestinalis TaxID=3073143 RepID=UPI00391EFD1E